MTTDPAMSRAQLDPRTMVRLSVGYSCGCADRPGLPLPLRDANTGVGKVIVCDRCGEYAVVIRITVHLVADVDTLRRLLIAGGVDDFITADSIASEQVRS